MGESEASKQFNERREKLLANYFHKLRVLINGIHNKNVIDQDTVKMLIPSHWSKSANEETLNRVVSNNLKSQETVHKNIEKTHGNPQFNRLVKSLSIFIDKNTGIKHILRKK